MSEESDLEYHRKWQKEHKESAIAATKKWRAAHPDMVKEQKNIINCIQRKALMRLQHRET